MKFAVIDVETTGLNPLSDRVIEIGIIFIEQNMEVSRFSQLIHPGKPLPAKISALTGITDEMLKGAPLFETIAPAIDEMTKGCILIGHHVLFDYSFIRNELRNCGISFSRKTVCTAELARLLFPDKKSHSLKSVCRYFGLENGHPHRALPDAAATALVFEKMKDRLGATFISSLLKRSHQNSGAIVEIIRNKVKNLPRTTGVYYFIGPDEKPLYIGKAKNIKSRVLSHFRGEGNSLKLLAVASQIKDIRYYETGSEFLAALQEDHEIRHYWPRFNNSQKVYNKRFGVVTYTDMKNRWRMGIASSGKSYFFRIFFHQYHLAVDYIRSQVNRYNLEGKLCGIGMENTSETDDITHNRNFETMLTEQNNSVNLELYFTGGRGKEERGFVLLENGTYKGFGFVNADREITPSILEVNLQARYSSITVESILMKLRKQSAPELVFKIDKNSKETVLAF